MSSETYLSVDIEADGPIPGEFSMLSLGCVAFTPKGGVIGRYSVNLDRLPRAEQDEKTMTWWKSQPAAWKQCRQDCVDPEKAMGDWRRWLEKLPGKLVFVGYPATFDFMFAYWYLVKFTGKSPFGFSGLDIKSYAMAKLGTTFRGTTKRTMPKDWFYGTGEHTHTAVEDAEEQGRLFFNMTQAK